MLKILSYSNNMYTSISTLYNSDEIKKITAIKFDVLGAQEIKQISAIDGKTHGIMIPDLYDNTEPKKGGLIDLRLGTTDNNYLCATCGFNSTYCIGHFGHMDLAEPVFHLGFINIVKKVLDCICLNCSKLLLSKNEHDIDEILKIKSGKSRLNEVRALLKNVKYCKKTNYGCGTPVSKIRVEIKKKTNSINIIAERIDNSKEGDNKKLKIILTPDVIYDHLKSISFDDCKILGFKPERTRPENMIHKIFPVPPISMRPSVKADFMGGGSRDDDLTRKLGDIIKSNLHILKQKELDPDRIAKYNKENIKLLQFHIAAYYDRDAISSQKDTKDTFKPLAARLKTKEGRVRNNLMGKRVNFTARTVITSDPAISVNELGVPIKIAMNITFPEVVTENNISYLTTLVKRGSDVYPGANFVFQTGTETGKRSMPVYLRYRKAEVELKYGDIVERHLVDGDIVLLNRQPTLHKQSMMGHRIKVFNDPELLTYRLSVAATTPYNAD
jgi:DNA-directed RNA polymerase II subunit RPB1